MDALKQWVVKRGEDNGCIITVKRSRDRSNVELQCQRGGQPKSRSLVRRTSSIKNNCPFLIIGKYDNASMSYMVHVRNETHNHDPVDFPEGHARLRKLTPDQLDLVVRLHRNGLKARVILGNLQDEYGSECKCILKDIHNAIVKIKSVEKIGNTPMKVLESRCIFFIINRCK